MTCHAWSDISFDNGKLITNERNLRKKMIVNIFQHFTLDSTSKLFTDHEDDDNEILVDDHRTNETCGGQILHVVAVQLWKEIRQQDSK